MSKIELKGTKNNKLFMQYLGPGAWGEAKETFTVKSTRRFFNSDNHVILAPIDKSKITAPDLAVKTLDEVSNVSAQSDVNINNNVGDVLKAKESFTTNNNLSNFYKSQLAFTIKPAGESNLLLKSDRIQTGAGNHTDSYVRLRKPTGKYSDSLWTLVRIGPWKDSENKYFFTYKIVLRKNPNWGLYAAYDEDKKKPTFVELKDLSAVDEKDAYQYWSISNNFMIWNVMFPSYRCASESIDLNDSESKPVFDDRIKFVPYDDQTNENQLFWVLETPANFTRIEDITDDFEDSDSGKITIPAKLKYKGEISVGQITEIKINYTTNAVLLLKDGKSVFIHNGFAGDPKIINASTNEWFAKNLSTPFDVIGAYVWSTDLIDNELNIRFTDNSEKFFLDIINPKKLTLIIVLSILVAIFGLAFLISSLFVSEEDTRTIQSYYDNWKQKVNNYYYY